MPAFLLFLTQMHEQLQKIAYVMQLKSYCEYFCLKTDHINKKSASKHRSGQSVETWLFGQYY